jgi:hydrogenase-4 component F
MLRGYQVMSAAGLGGFAARQLVGLGLLSLVVAAFFIVGQRDYKRMLAFSSVEHMGILALGAGLGGVGWYGCLLHALNHSASKALLFLTAGNVHVSYRSKRAEDVRGMLHSVPLQGALFLCGMFAVSGLPPFGTFFSELMILQAGVNARHLWVGAAYLALLVIVAVGMAAVVLPMAHGRAREQVTPPRSAWLTLPPVLLVSLSIVLGLWLPPELHRLISAAAGSLAR